MRSHKQPLPFITGTRGPAAAVLATAVLVLAPVVVGAQSIIPNNPPTITYSYDVSTATPPALEAGEITQYNWTGVSAGVGSSSEGVSCGAGFWGTHLKQAQGLAASQSATLNRPHPLGPAGRSSVFVINQSVAGNPGYLGTDWDNFRFEFDFTGDANAAVGVVWGGQDITGNLDVDHGYLFYVDQMPTELTFLAGDNAAQWHLVRRRSGYDLEIASGPAILNDGIDALRSVYQGQCYRMRVEFFCGTLRVQIARIECGAGDCTVTHCDGANTVCSPLGNDPYGACGTAIQWCDLFTWVDPEPLLVPGFVGPFAGGIDRAVPAVSRFDNLLASTWNYDCNLICPDVVIGDNGWTGWTDDWDSTSIGPEGVHDIELKHLYTGTLIDYEYGYLYGANHYIDSTMLSGPTTVTLTDNSSETRDNCGGWTVLYTNVEKPIVDLPDPGSADSNLNEMLAFLEPMSSSVKLVYDETQAPGARFSFVDDYDNDRLDLAGDPNPAYNPNPLPTRGATPIRNSLEDAFTWYAEQRTNGAWALDPLEDCRLWYVIFITDGEESCCEGDGCTVEQDWACQPNGPAEKFHEPFNHGYPGLDPVKIYTVGFSEGVAADSPLKCVATATEGRFFTATNSDQLVNVLYEVLDEMQETDRSFIPFAVSPPPPGAAGQLSADDEFLTVFPHFVPINKNTVWRGDLLAFEFNKSQPVLPTTAECTVDTSQVVWQDSGGNPAGAAAILAEQMADYSSGNRTRHIYFGSDYSGSWQRYKMDETMFGNASLLADFQDVLDISSSGSASALEAVEVTNFIRNYRENPASLALSPAPQSPPRPDPAGDPTDSQWSLGDIYHSQPVVVNPPNNFMYFSDYGQGPAHDYLSFRSKHANRRRVVLAGANDGQLHAFDGGFYDRDETNFDDRHDMGTGKEVFAWVPEAVAHRLPLMTYGTEHQYTVDGPIAVADVYIDPDGMGSAPEQWRTVALATMRRGGRGVVALDITTPDEVSGPDYIPTVADYPGCLDSTAADCDGVSYPHLLWEFHDVDGTGTPNDADGGCATAGLSGDQCRPYWDLGWTWSKPAIARVGIYALDGGGNVVPDDTFVAFFGGGWDANSEPTTPAGGDNTGNYFYGVDIETGTVVVKELIDVGTSVPGSPAVLDSDNDGFHDKVYFGDTNGAIWRYQLPSPYVDFVAGGYATVYEAAHLRRIFDVSGTLGATAGRQQFFVQPTLVPVLFNGSNYTYAIAMGSGDRANLGDMTADITNHFYVVLDDLDNDPANLAYDETDLVARAYDDMGIQNAFTAEPGSTVCVDNAFVSAKGWYLELRLNLLVTAPDLPEGSEKVNYEATVFANHVYFTTFQPGEGLAASNPVEICTPSTPPPTGTPIAPTPTPTPDPSGPAPGPDVRCKASGIGRIYDLGLTCGLGEYTEVDDIVTGISDYTIGDTTYVVFPTSGADAGLGEIKGGLGLIKGHPIAVISSTSNWRQE